MMRWLGPAIALAIAAVVGHIFVLQSAPTLIMSRAMAVMEERGIPLHGFARAPRMTPDTQTVVRPSPDLAYSVCRFDLSQSWHSLRVRMAAYDGYSSVSFFADNTDNFLTVRGDGEAREVLLLPPGSKRAPDNPPELVMVAPSQTGVILIRRLAPTQADYEMMSAIAANDVCEELPAS